MTCSFSKEFSSSSYTGVENAFIKEYLPIATGEAVKVYLYGLFACQNPSFDLSLNDLSSFLKLSNEEVIDCFKFWEEFGLCAILSQNPLSVVYYPVRQTANAKPKKIKAEKYSEFTKSLQALIPTRMIGTAEYSEYFNIMETYAIKPEAMLLIVSYCVGIKGQEISYRYVSKVAKDFGERGINTVEKIENELSAYVLRTSEINKILSALSLKRKAEIDDLNLLKKWTEELGFETDNIIFAASRLKKGSMQKLDELILELYSMKAFSKEEIEGYAEKKSFSYNLAVRINKALSVYMEVLDPVVDNYVNKWLSYGYTDDSLLYVANHLFKQGKNTLQIMDQTVESLRNQGYVTLTAVNDYFESVKITDAFIEKVLSASGISRKATDWDRENYKTWKTWNFSDEMILRAAGMSSGKSSPLQYMNGILSNWKNSGTFTISQTEQIKDELTPENYNKEYQLRREKAISRAQKNLEKALSIDGFKEVYSRLNSIEKDLAFADVDGDEAALLALEKEKSDLIEKRDALLMSASLKAKDLMPNYKCKKCNDTGYVGTKRCDCY